MMASRIIRWALTFVAGACLALPANAEILIAGAAPMTGRLSWYGENWERGAGLAVRDINARGGLLGQRVELILGDDYCDPEQAVALARSLVARAAAVVIGHTCSEAAIAAAPVYAAARVIMIAPSASNPALTDSGWPNVFRTFGRDDLQGRIAAEHLARDHAAERIAIVFTPGVYSRGLAAEAKRRLNELGIQEVAFLRVDPAAADWSAIADSLAKQGVNVVYSSAHTPDTALLIRHAADLGHRFKVIGGDALGMADFWLIAGGAGEGATFTSGPDPRDNPLAAPVVERFRASGYDPEGFTLYVYAAVQAWAQAVERAGTLDPETVIKALRDGEFDTVLGRIGFDEKGDVEGITPFVWFVWRDGKYVPLEEGQQPVR